jgi:site-specific recombinase XerD
LPLLGPIADDFATWLQEKGYQRSSRLDHLRALVHIDRYLRRQGCRRLDDLTRIELHACWNVHHRRRRGGSVAGATRALEHHLEDRRDLGAPVTDPAKRSDPRLAAYAAYLEDVRGNQPSTIDHHVHTASQFLAHMAPGANGHRLATVAAPDIESFVTTVGRRLGRASLQHTIAHLRGFLRFLATAGEVRPGLDAQIDTPRLYRLEQLPRALAWQTVRSLLQSIDRKTHVGLRDYTMFFLMATYGLRSSEIVALTLDDICWRSHSIRITQLKTDTPLLLPLTDAAATALVRYLRRGRPASSPYRQVFLRSRAPTGTLAPGAVTKAFDYWSRRSGLDIHSWGPHCLRHSFAIHLLRRGTAFKTIGDLLGHRSCESTSQYVRLALEDLRGVALPVPLTRSSRRAQGGHS